MSLLSRKYRAWRGLNVFAVLAIFLLLSPALGFSAEWSLKGSIDQFLGYDTNVRMRQAGEEEGSFFYKVIPVLTMLHKTDVSEIKADAVYGTQRYSDLPGFDQDIQNYSLGGSYFTERFTWGIEMGYAITPTRNAAFQDSGNFGAQSESTRKSIAPTVTYRLNELDSLTLSYSYSATDFNRAQADNFRNFISNNINLAWQRAWTERYSTGVSFFYTIFESQTDTRAASRDFNYDSYGLNFSNNYTLTERLKLAGTIGIRNTDSTGVGVGGGSIDGSSIGFLANFNADYTGDNYTTYLSFNRSLQPSNQGQLQEQTGLDWGFNYKLTENVSAGFSFDYLNSTQVNLINQVDRDNIVLQPRINWRITPDWSVTGSYRYRSQDRSKIDITDTSNARFAESHLFMLTINYNWQGLSISR